MEIENRLLMKKMKLIFCIILLTCQALSVHAEEQVTLRKMKVGVFISPPFVMADTSNIYSGMAIDLWKIIEGELNAVSQYVNYSSLYKLLLAIQAKEIDIAVTNLTVTYDRAQIVKFSYPWYDAGLRIMVKNDRKGSIWREMKQNGQIHSYMFIFLILTALTILQTMLFRKKDPEYPQKWKDGLALSFYNLMNTLRGGTLEYKFLGWAGHLLAVIWMIFGIGLVAYVTSTITSSMTKISLTSEINALSDLPGKLIGVETGGVEEAFLRSLGIQTSSYDNVLHAIEALKKNEVHAVVSDAPVLEYWAYKNPQEKVSVVGSLFHPDKYALATYKENSELIDSISMILIKLYESGKIKELKDEYMGVNNE